jgi:NitT/TauT family transport system substrate-binding protein
VSFRSKLRFLAGVALWTLTSLASASNGAQRVNIATLVWVGYAPFYVADALHLYAKYHLDVRLQIFSDAGLIPAAMASKAVDAGTITYDQLLGSAGEGTHFKVVMPIDFSDGGDGIVAVRAVASVKDFKGKRIGFTRLSAADFLLYYALQTVGLTEKDIVAVNLDSEAVIGAMASGALPIAVTYEPNISRIVSLPGHQFHVVFSSREAPGIITDVLALDEGYIARNRPVVVALIQGYLEALSFMKSKPDDAAKIISKVLGTSQADTENLLKLDYFIPLSEMRHTLTKSDASTSLYGSGPVIISLLQRYGQLKTVPTIESTIDRSFVDALSGR